MGGVVIVYFLNKKRCNFVFPDSPHICDAIKAFKKEHQDIAELVQDLTIYDGNGNRLISRKDLKSNHKGGLL